MGRPERRGQRASIGISALAALATAMWAAPALAQQPPAASPDKWGAYIDLDGRLGTGQRKLGEAELFLPLTQDDRTLLFGDLRGKLDNQQSHEGNFGLGLRRMLSHGWNIGGYGFYDRRHTHYDNGFNQVTIGAEALGTDFDFRANGYIPFGDTVKNVDGLNSATLSGTTVVFRGGEEHALSGFDAEVGWRVPIWTADAPQALRLYAGGYRFDDSTVDAVQGPRVRAELTLYEVPYLWDGARVTADAEWQHDDARGNQTFAGLRLRLPLQTMFGGEAPKLTAQERRMTDAPVRDVDIVAEAGAFGAPETATATADGNAITVLSSASTTGANLQNALNTAGANSAVILSGSFDTGGAITTLPAGQTVMGAGSIVVRAPSGRTATLTTPAATLTGNVGAANYAVVMANNSTLMGMVINNTNTNAAQNAQGVKADGVTGAKIINNTINATMTNTGTAHGIDIFNAASNITVSGNTITATGSGGASIVMAIQVNGAAHPSATIAGNRLSASGGGTENATVDLNQANILSGSSGNTAAAGTCQVSAAGVGGTVTFTNAAACGP